MSDTSSKKCPQCGAALPSNAPAGLCPNCLMQLNLKTETVFTDDQPAPQAPLPPEKLAPHFPQLEILECLGRGGMGVVYKARQKSLNRLAALKLLAPERVGDAKFAERFAKEAQALAALNHPNIVTVYDFGQAGGYYYLLMEFIDGPNLRQLLRARKFTPEEALTVVPLLCDALQFAHERGIVHRDIKPENLLLDKSGRVKVADFGIARMLGGNGSLSQSSGEAREKVVGTPGYTAPEQKTDPHRVDSRADIYSLGVVFYEMLTGELPGKPIEPPSRKVEIDVRLDKVVLRALERTPELRFQTASELKTEVEILKGREPARQPAGDSNPITTYWAMFLTGSSGVLGAVAFALFPSPPALLVWAILAAAVLGTLMAVPARLTRLGKQAAVVGGINIGIWVIVFAIVNLYQVRSFYIGNSSFPRGDLIVITSVTRTPSSLRVKGHYNLVSADKAHLALYITSSHDTQAPTGRRQWIEISKGAGDFDLLHTNLVPGLPHVTMYSTNGNGFGGVYFGTRAQADEEKTLDIGHYAKAEEAVSSKSATELEQEGWQLWQRGQLADATKKFQESVKLDAGRASAWNGLGWAEFNSWQIEEAVTAFQKAISLDTNLPGALNGLGQIYLAQTNYSEAEEYLLKAAPNAPAAWSGLARLYLLEGKFDQAQRWAQNIVDSGQADEIANKMLQAAEDKQLSEGLRMVIEPQAPSKPQTTATASGDAASMNGQSAGQLEQEGWQLWQRGQLADATTKFQEAVKLDPSRANAWNGLGWSAFNSGQTEQAETAFEKVLSLEPNHPAALNGLGQIYLAQTNYAKAEEFLLKAASKAPAAWFGLARLYLLQGEFEQAQKWAQDLVDSGQADAVAKKMLQAAKDKQLSEGLRMMMEPHAPAKSSAN